MSLFFLAVIMFISISGCSSSSLVGKWAEEEAQGNQFESFEFFSDGTYTSNHPNYNGTYSVTGDRLRLSGNMAQDETYTFKVKGDTLELSTGGSMNYVYVYKKVN